MNPETLRYNQSHEWAALTNEQGKSIVVVGITDFAVEQLTDLVYMELPKPGTTVNQGEQFGEVESVKAVSPLYSPVSGKVVAIHDELADSLDTLARDPFGEGWMIKVEVSDQDQLSKLLDRDGYLKQIAG
jgi:glycine cleavage system H protein